MSLKQAAQHLAAQGRGPDRTLVHMSPREVAGLQAIAMANGGSLTINPETGLAEAGFLDRMMPALIGAGLMVATGGTSMALTPELIGLGVGGLQTARTGSLGQGLMAGLGAYGGAGLAGGLGAGATGAEAAAPQAPTTTFNPATAADTTAYAPTPTQFGAFGEAPVTAATPDPSMYTSGTPGVTDAAQRAASASYGTAQMPLQTPPVASPVGIGSLSGADAFKYGAATLGSMADTTRPPIPTEEKYNGPLSKYYMSKDYKAYDPQPPNPYYEPQRYAYGMADGGPVEQMSNAAAVGMNTGYPQADITGHAYATPWQTPVSQNVVQDAADTGVNRMSGQMLAGGGSVKRFDLGGLAKLAEQAGASGGSSEGSYNPSGGGPIAEFIRRMQSEGRLAQGGMAYAGGGQLGGYSDGGRMLKGPGDGMSDSIPAQIGSKQPARLADGEFVVPADVVSHLGNGSSDAGAKQLYKMMDRIRAARTGKKRQAPQVNPNKAMPA